MADPLPKLLFLITDLDLGGSPLVVRELSRGLRATGQWDVEVASLRPGGQVADLIRQEGTVVHSLNAPSSKYFLEAVKRWTTLVRQVKPDVAYSVLVHANAVAAAGRRWTPAHVWVQSIHTVQPRPRWHWWLQGRLAGRSDMLIAPSSAVIEKLEHYGRIERPTVIPNGIDVNRFANASPIPVGERPWPAGAFVVGYVGRFDPVKNLPLLLEALAVLRGPTLPHDLPHLPPQAPKTPIHVALVGYGPQENELKRLAERLDISRFVHFVGPTQMPEKWYKSFDIFCLPSEAEGFGLAVAEAMAAGVPVVAADTPAMRDLISTGLTGELLLTPTPYALAHVIQALKDAPDARKQLSSSAFFDVRDRFSLQTCIAQHNQILQNFISFI